MTNLTIHIGEIEKLEIPEANLLFPEYKKSYAQQRIIARDIAKSISNGYDIILLTCSHVIIRELNILINLSIKSPKIRRKIYRKYPYYNDSLILYPSNIKAYEYDQIGNKNLCEIDEEGIILKATDIEITLLNLTSDKIYQF